MKISVTIALKIALLIISNICQAQTPSTLGNGSNSNLVLKGRVIDATTKNAVPFSSIGILNKSTGTVGNENGEFVYSCPVKFQSDTIYFSSIGYETFKIISKNFNQLENGTI